MDEILASIRKIISEDDPPAAQAREAGEIKPADEEDVLVLTQKAPDAEDAIVGEAAEASAAGAFDKLSSAVNSSASERASLAMPAAGRSLEDVTRELLRPMLKAWLDEHLEAIVQARVDEEVERIARRRVR